MIGKKDKDVKKERNSLEEKDIKITINREAAEKEQMKEEPKPEELPLEELSKAELIEKIEKLDEEKAKSFDLYLRAQAEMENVRKRARKEKEDWLKYAHEALIKEILPVIDNLEQAISHSNGGSSLDALREGVELTLKGFRDSLTKSGLEEVKAQGEPFDPCYHEAVSEVEDKTVKAGTVVYELQKGYLLNQRLVRPAKVVVSRGGERDRTDTDKEIQKECENN